MKDVKLDLEDKKYKFYQVNVDTVIDSETMQIYKVFNSDDGREQLFIGNKGVADLYWPELTMEEFKFLHPDIFK